MWLIPPRSIDARVEELREAARDRERTFTMGQAARRTAESWSWDLAGPLFTTCWGRVLREQAGPFSITCVPQSPGAAAPGTVAWSRESGERPDRGSSS